ncbi:hypothetical protein ACTXG6_24780 [Pseudonocardia sp. Cha107L01]|uniref:hypothetical protein n=1 Tax=Pseudonocardia sp. Cha107L01 TaxID=3457576 RepID=UPI00403EF345
MSGSGRSSGVAMPASLASVDGDPLIQSSPPGVLWTRGNSAEAAPGVLTAMNYSFYGQLSEVNVRRALYGAPPAHDLRELVALRRSQHRSHLGVTIPETWTGQPPASPIVVGSPRDVRSVHG